MALSANKSKRATRSEPPPAICSPCHWRGNVVTITEFLFRPAERALDRPGPVWLTVFAGDRRPRSVWVDSRPVR